MILQAATISTALRQLRVAFPQQSFPVGQDAEWCVVSDGGSWREFRFHDYAQIYEVPGLYEKIFMEHLKSRSHVVMAEALARELQLRERSLSECRILDLVDSGAWTCCRRRVEPPSANIRMSIPDTRWSRPSS